jgi:hypothetical protein
MSSPLAYYINIGFAWFLVLMSVWGYATILRKTRQRMKFWIFFGLAWLLFGVSHILTLYGIPAGVWYLMTVRIAGYVMMAISVLNLMIQIVKNDEA